MVTLDEYIEKAVEYRQRCADPQQKQYTVTISDNLHQVFKKMSVLLPEHLPAKTLVMAALDTFVKEHEEDINLAISGQERLKV